MRISDWSSDVCSSDLIAERQRRKARRRADSIARHRDGEKARARALSQQDADKAALQAVINAMTNHERHCWSRHCGNDRKKRTDIAVARRFQTPLVPLLRAAVSRIDPARSEERRVGKEGVGEGRSRW